MHVTNVNGSGRFPAPAGHASWLDYWKAQTNKNPTCCSKNSCENDDLVGAHVQKDSSADKKWYIVPLCKSCNGKSSSEIMEVSATLVPVPSNL